MTKRSHTAQDGRKTDLMRIRWHLHEKERIQKLSTDERRAALLAAAERKEE
jgi:hypothetical protein